MAQRMSTILRPPDTSIDAQKSGTLKFVPDWGDLNCDSTTSYIREYISFPPDDAGPSSSGLEGLDGLDATPRPILTELHLDCDRYYPQQLRLAEGRLKEAAALQAPTWRKLEKDGAQLTEAERHQIFDYPDFAMILLVTRTGGLKRPRQGPIDSPEENTANAAAIAAETPIPMHPQSVQQLRKELHARVVPKAVENPTSIALLHKTKQKPNVPAAAAAPSAAERMQQDDIRGREEHRIESDRKETVRWRKKNAQPTVRPHANALTREKPVALTSTAPTPAATLPPATIPAPSTITSNSVTKLGPKKPLLVLTPVDRTDTKVEKTAAEVREMCNARSNTGEPKKIIVVRKTGDCTGQANRSQKGKSTGPVLGTWRRSPTAKITQQPHHISDERATEKGESPEGVLAEARKQDLEAFRDYIDSSAAAAPAAPAAIRPAAAAPAAVAADRDAFAHDHEWYSPECAWPLRNPNRCRTPVIVPPLVRPRDQSTIRDPPTFRHSSNNTSTKMKRPRAAPKIAKVVVAPPAATQQRRKAKPAEQFPFAWMYDGVITRPPSKIAYDATVAKVVEQPKQAKQAEVRPSLPPKRKRAATSVKTNKRSVQEPKQRDIQEMKNRKDKEPKEMIPASTPATDPDDFMDDFFDFDIIDDKPAEPTRNRSERQVSTDSYATSIDSAFFEMPDADYEQIVSEVSEEEFNAEFARFNNMETN
ncbi:hypothetical protein PRIPAC_83429 [Pristionchus pacificus]|uniref:Uncharacterized protein n=1 Tax=Pristionchus pacificus TaxID=54126 RepID=A0A2A6BST7_PRIPA|nr:hypothetical protein PRIPAC_83429 [Pristionchus pacificus]|eukprot:PDM69032.1 hypothetical protein PRIPAC_47334 [Pristionchus pacificus]